MTDRILGIIGMMRKASALVIGEDQVSEAIQKGKVKVLIIPSDAGESVRKFAVRASANRHLEVIEIPYQTEVLSDAVGLTNCRIAAATDLGFAKAMVNILSDLEKQKKMSEGSLKLVQKHDISYTLTRMEEIYEKVLQAREEAILEQKKLKKK